MARQKVEQVQCDRCKQMELQPVRETDGAPAPAFEASFEGQRLVYADLCAKCRTTLMHLWEELKEWHRQRKYTVLQHGPQVGVEQAVPLQPAPNYSPPQPHSAAAAKR